LKRKTILQGEHTQHQLELIFDLIGTPTKDELKNIENDKWREFARKAKKRKSQDFDKFFPKSNPLAIDLLKKCLVFDPKKRYNVK